jgi:ribosome maturation factor RimP
MSEALQDIVTTELAPLGLELFELKSGGSKGRPVLDVRVERADGKPVTVDDCARASRAIEAKLDEGNVLGEKYVLEVSSPGIERPLRHAADWRRFIGRDAVITVDSDKGMKSREVRIAGVEGDAGKEIVVVEDAKGNSERLPLAAVKKARLAFNWKR